MTDTAPATPTPAHRLGSHDPRTATQNVVDALSGQGLTVTIDNLSGGCAGIRIMLPDGTAIVISDLDGSLPADGQPHSGWIAEHTTWQHGGPTGYPGEPITTVYVSTAPGDDTAAMIAAVTAHITARQGANRHRQARA